MSKVLIKKYTDEDKVRMANASAHILETLEKEFGKGEQGIPYIAKILETCISAYGDQEAMQKIITLNADGKNASEFNQKVKRARQIIEGMQKSHLNLILFRDDEEVWFQYYLSQFLGKPTFIIALKSDEIVVQEKISKGGLVKAIEFVEEYSTETVQVVADKFSKMMKKHSNL